MTATTNRESKGTGKRLMFGDERTLKVLRNWALLGFAITGAGLAWATNWSVQSFLNGSPITAAIIVFAMDLILILAFMAFAVQQLESKRVRRATRQVQAPIHLRFSRAFAFAAFLPTAIVSVTATAVIGLFLGNWLVSDVQGSLVKASNAVRDYVEGAVAKLVSDAPLFAAEFESRLRQNPRDIDQPRRLLNELQEEKGGNWKYAFVIDETCQIVARGDRSYLFRYDPPPINIIAEVAKRDQISSNCGERLAGMPPYGNATTEQSNTLTGRIWLLRTGVLVGAIYPYDASELAALIKLQLPKELYLLLVTQGTSEALLQLNATLEGPTGEFSENSVRQLGKSILIATLTFLPVALITITGVILLGRRFSSRLSPPFMKLANAVERIGQGRLTPIEPDLLQGEDEIAAFAGGFDRMITQLRSNIEMRRSVVENVTSAVVGYAPDRTITFANRPAEDLLNAPSQTVNGSGNRSIVSEVMAILDQIDADLQGKPCEKRLQTLNDGRLTELLLRAAAWRSSGGTIEGYVVTFDDVTQLVNAEGQAAWAEAAKLVSHEVRNPLQGMLNSIFLVEADLKRCAIDKDPAGAEIRASLELIRSRVDALVRLTNAFATIGRLPELTFKRENVTELLATALHYEQEQNKQIEYCFNAPTDPVIAMVDPDYISSLTTNLLINARHAINEQTELSEHAGLAYEPAIRLDLTRSDECFYIEVCDNGPGFPDEPDARSNILRAGVTTRKEGSGLGLFIVRDAASKHGGSVKISDAPAFAGCNHTGASVCVSIRYIPPPQDEGDVSMTAIGGDNAHD